MSCVVQQVSVDSFKCLSFSTFVNCIRINLSVANQVHLEQVTKAHRLSRGIALSTGAGGVEYKSLLSLTSALDGDEWSTPRPGRFTPWKDPV